MSKELKPCPYCSSIHILKSNVGWWEISCLTCGVMICGDSEKEVIKKWNKRTDNNLVAVFDKEKCIGFELKIDGKECLIFLDQNSMPGIRVGTNFVEPLFNKLERKSLQDMKGIK